MNTPENKKLLNEALEHFENLPKVGEWREAKKKGGFAPDRTHAFLRAAIVRDAHAEIEYLVKRVGISVYAFNSLAITIAEYYGKTDTLELLNKLKSHHRLCYECGQKEVQTQNVKGQSFPYKQYESVELKFDFEAMMCNNCEEIVLHSGQAKNLDVVLEKSIKLEKDNG